MKERPILFSGPMVRALLEGKKTQTRRVLKGSTEFKGPYNPAYLEAHKNESGWKNICPYGKAGDRLWVRETFRYAEEDLKLPPNAPVPVDYRATPMKESVGCDGFDCLSWHPSIHMPRWASRITLEITEVRVQRLQEISEADCEDEGLLLWIESRCAEDPVANNLRILTRKSQFSCLWDSINSKRPGCSWADNPFVWALTFKRL